MKILLWLALLPSLVFAEKPDSINLKRDIFGLGVAEQHVVIYPEVTIVSASELSQPGNAFEQFLGQAEALRTTRYFLLFIQPGSASLQRRVRQMIQARGFDVGFDPVGVGSNCSPTFFDDLPASGVEKIEMEAYVTSQKIQSTKGPCEIEVRADSLIILTNNALVMRDELQNPGNALLQWVDQCLAHNSYPSKICNVSGSDEFYVEVLKMVYRACPQGTWILKLGLPLEVPANGRTPIYIECRSNQLFSVSADNSTEAIDISNLASLNPAMKYICFLVRPDSFEIFRKARKAAWERGLDISCELQDESGPFAIGADGHPLFPERITR